MAECGDVSNNDGKLQSNFTWTLDDFLKLACGSGQVVKSKRFSATGNLLDEWWMECYPGGDIKEREGWVSVYLYSAVPITAEVLLSITDSNGWRFNVYDLGTHNYLPVKGWGSSKYISKLNLLSQAETLLPGDKLSVKCEITIHLRDSNPLSIPTTSKLITDFGNILEIPKLNDVTLVVGETKIPAHQLILASRSTVFSSMFDSEMKESQSKEIHIEDASVGAVQQLLHYIYTGKCPGLREHSQEIIYLAEKYDLVELKAVCGLVLSSDLSLDNCLERLVLADRLRADNLKAAVLDFIVHNINQIRSRKTWTDMPKSNGDLVDQILGHVLKKCSLTDKPEPKK